VFGYEQDTLRFLLLLLLGNHHTDRQAYRQTDTGCRATYDVL
jgi:hypothetical protein